MFYKMRHNIDGKSITVSALDIALENNQMRALNAIIKYIVQYQNSVSFHFLFDDILIDLISKGIEVTPLLNSKIFCYKFECEDYPRIHTDNTNMIVPYNGSYF